MRWTPQAHYQVPGGEPADTRRGYWENNPDPEPEAEPAGPDAATWAATVVAAQSDAAAEAVAVVLKAHTELAERLKGPEMLEGTTEGVDTIAWKLPGLEQTAPAALKAGMSMFRCFSAAFDRLGTQWRLCTQTDTSDGDHGSLAVFLQRVGDATTSEPVAFALRVVADDGDQVLAEHIVEGYDFQAASSGWGKLRLHTSLAQVHEKAAQGVISVRLLWFRTASTPLPPGAGPAMIPSTPAPVPASASAAAATGPAEGQPERLPAASQLPEGTPERRTQRRTRTVRLAKAAVGFGMNIDNRGVIVSVIPGSPASDNGVPPGCRIIAVQGVPCDGKPQIVSQLGQAAVVAVTTSPGVQFELDLGEGEVDDGERERDPAVRLAKAAADGGGKALGKVKAFGKGRRGSLPDGQ